MKITQFKKMLATHGADLSRWEGADPAEAKKLLGSSAEAAALHREAAALDRALGAFEAGKPDPALLDKVMRRTGGEASVHVFPSAGKAARFPQPLLWGGAAAMAVAAGFALFVFSALTDAPSAPQLPVVAVNDAAPAAEDTATLLAAMEALMEEEVAGREIIALIETAQADIPAAPRRAVFGPPTYEESVDMLLDDLFTIRSRKEPSRQESDLWDLFLAAETREL